LLAEAATKTDQPSAPIIVRTRFFDDALLCAQADGVSQVAILAAGMDARAFRLAWHNGTTVYEVDQPHIIDTKNERLGGERSSCRRVAVGVDLSGDWPKVLLSQGFDSSSSTVWLIEGLLQYLHASDVERLFDRVDALSAPGSVLLYDVIGKTMLEAPFLQPSLEFMAELGAPWIFGSDTPGALAEDRAWTATVTDAAEPGNRWGRWMHPPVPADVPGAPRGYLVEAIKDQRPV
jgi:methyltransferase (TIGR00027 family)